MVLGPGLSLSRLLQLKHCSMDENFELGVSDLSDTFIGNQIVTLPIYCWQDQLAGPVLPTTRLEVLSATPFGHLFINTNININNLHSWVPFHCNSVTRDIAKELHVRLSDS